MIKTPWALPRRSGSKTLKSFYGAGIGQWNVLNQEIAPIMMKLFTLLLFSGQLT